MGIAHWKDPDAQAAYERACAEPLKLASIACPALVLLGDRS